jgi:hypothetical protein
MIVTGIFHLEEEALGVPPSSPDRVQASRDQVYEERIGDNETLVAVRARSLRQAMLLRDLLAQAGARGVAIDAEAA